MSISLLGALIHSDRTEAERRVLHALEVAKGDRRKAAEALGTTHRSFYRFVERMKLWDKIDALMQRKGFPMIPGPPRSSKRIRDKVLEAEGRLDRAAKMLDLKEDALRARITELGLWDDLDRLLAAAKLKPLERRAS